MQRLCETRQLNCMTAVLIEDGSSLGLVIKTNYGNFISIHTYQNPDVSLDSIIQQDLTTLKDILKSHPNIIYIRASGNCIITKVVVAIIDACKNLQELDIEYNEINQDDIGILKDVLKKISYKISLHLNYVPDNLLSNLMPISNYITSLNLIVFNDNTILTRELIFRCLKKFRLEGNNQDVTKMLPALLLSAANSLEDINLQSSGLDLNNLEALISTLLELLKLHTLAISLNNASAQNILNLLTQLPKHSIKNLDISKNDLTNIQEITALVERLKLLENLFCLNIRLCNITEEGLKILAKALPHMPIRELDVGFLNLDLGPIMNVLNLTNITRLYIGEHALTKKMSSILKANKEKLDFKESMLSCIMTDRRTKKRHLPPELWQLIFDEFKDLKVKKTYAAVENHNPPKSPLHINYNPTFLESHPKLAIAIYSTICSVLVLCIIWLQRKIDSPADNTFCFN